MRRAVAASLIFSLLGGTPALAYFWSVDHVVLKNENNDFVSEYVTGETDTFGKYETVTLIDCTHSEYQAYTVIHQYELGSGTNGTPALVEGETATALRDGLEGLRTSGRGVSFRTVGKLAEEIGIEKPEYGTDAFADGVSLTLNCNRLGRVAGGWKVR